MCSSVVRMYPHCDAVRRCVHVQTATVRAIWGCPGGPASVPRMHDARYVAPFRDGGAFPVDQTLTQRLLQAALDRGGDYADLFFEYEVSGSFGLEEGILKSAGRGVDLGLGVRVMQGDATGYAYVEGLEESALFQAARTAAGVAAGGGAPQAVDIARPYGEGLPRRYEILQETFTERGESKRELLQRADRAARAADGRVVRVSASFGEGLREILVATSTGLWARDRQPLMRFGVSVIVQDGEKRQSGSSSGGGRMGFEYFENRSPEAHAQEAVRQALVMLDAREAPAGEFPVVLGPSDSGILLHEAVGHGLEADFNRKGTSNFTGRVGERVASELCTVVDDATLEHGRGSINVDDEGHIPTSVTLIEKGVLRGYMQDQHSAKYFDVKANGHGRRESFKSHPMPRMTNTLLLAGEDDPEDIIKSVDRGVYAKKFGGGQVDISNGDFVFSLTEGYLIEEGRLTAPLKGVNLIGNGPEAMGRVTMLGHDFAVSDGMWTCGKDGQSVPVGVGCPTMKVSSMTVGGTSV